MNASVQEVAPEVTENIGDDLFSGITGDLLPNSPTKSTPKAKSEPEVKEPENNDSTVDISDLVPGAEPAEKQKEKPAKEEPAKSAEGLSPEDVIDSSTLAGGDLPDDLVKEEDTDKVFKGDIKAKDAFLKERAYNKTLREQLKEAQSALMAAKADEKVAEEVEKYKAEIEEYKKKVETLETDIGKLDLTRSSSFREQYDDKVNRLGGKMVELLVQEGVAQEEAVQFARQVVAEQRPSVRERLIDDMAPGLKGTLVALGLQVDEVVRSRNAALENWKATAAGLDEAESRKRLAAMTQQVDKFVVSAIDEAKKLGNPYYIETKDEAWNEQVEKRKQALKGLLMTGDMGKLSSLVAEGITAADLRSRYAKLLKEKREIEEDLNAVVKGVPRFSGRSTSPATNPEPKRDEIHAVPLEDAITNDLLPPKPR